MQSGRRVPTFLRNILFAFSGSKTNEAGSRFLGNVGSQLLDYTTSKQNLNRSFNFCHNIPLFADRPVSCDGQQATFCHQAI